MVHKIPQPSVSSTPRFVGHITEIRLSLFAFLSLADAARLLATCRKLREDTENVDLLLKQSPVTTVVFHSHTISSLGCLPLSPTRPLHEASSASALSVAALWGKELLPICYQWHHGRRISLRVEPFVLPLPGAVEAVSDICTALEDVLTGLGRAFLEGKNANKAIAYTVADFQKPPACNDADTEEEDDEFPSVFAMDDYDSDYESTSESDLEDELDVEWHDMVASSRLEPHLFAKVHRPLQWLFKAHHFQSTRWATVPVDTTKPDAAWRTHLLAGVSPSRCVVGGVFLRARAF